MLYILITCYNKKLYSIIFFLQIYYNSFAKPLHSQKNSVFYQIIKVIIQIKGLEELVLNKNICHNWHGRKNNFIK